MVSEGPTAPRETPLIGREGELTRMLAAHSEGAPGVVLVGEAGVGKSRLAGEVLRRLGDAGVHTESARATRSSSGIPGGAFAPLLPARERGGREPHLAQLLEAALRERAAGRGAALWVDDGHLLDPACAAALLTLVERSRAFAIVTVRAGEPCPDAVTELWKDANASRVDLRLLPDADIEALAAVAAGGPLQLQAARWVAGTSRGNALYAKHLIAGAVESKALTWRDGAWQLRRRPAASPTLRELIGSRVGDLSADERRGLELVALGEPLRFTEAQRLIGQDTLVALEQRSLITLGPNAAADVRIAHPLFGEVILHEMPVARGRAQQILLAETLEARASPLPADAVRIAQWLTDAGAPVSNDQLLAAARASNLAGMDTGLEFARRAVQEGAGAEALKLLARGLVIRGQALEAEDVLASVAEAPREAELALELVRLRASNLLYGLGRGPQALAAIDAASNWSQGEEWTRRLALVRLQFAAVLDPPGSRAAELEQALASESLDESTRRQLRRALAGDRLAGGRAAEAARMLSEVRFRLPIESEVEFHELATVVAAGLCAGDDLPGLERRMRVIFDDAIEARDFAVAGLAAAAVAATSLLGGRYLDAESWLGEALSLAERQDPFTTRLLALSLQAGVALARDDHTGAARASCALEANLAEGAAQRGTIAWVGRGRAWGMLAEADGPAAQALLRAQARELHEFPALAAELLYEAMRAGCPARELLEELSESASRCDGPLTSAYVEHVSARSRGDAREMLAAAERFAGLGAARYACEAAAHAAAAFASEGRSDSARRAAARSRELQPSDQGGVPLAIDGVDRDALELTPREAQLVGLASRGLSNAEIADRLVISTRTVETHIYRAMRKLGINDRRDFR